MSTLYIRYVVTFQALSDIPSNWVKMYRDTIKSRRVEQLLDAIHVPEEVYECIKACNALPGVLEQRQVLSLIADRYSYSYLRYVHIKLGLPERISPKDPYNLAYTRISTVKMVKVFALASLEITENC